MSLTLAAWATGGISERRCFDLLCALMGAHCFYNHACSEWNSKITDSAIDQTFRKYIQIQFRCTNLRSALILSTHVNRASAGKSSQDMDLYLKVLFFQNQHEFEIRLKRLKFKGVVGTDLQIKRYCNLDFWKSQRGGKERSEVVTATGWERSCLITADADTPSNTNLPFPQILSSLDFGETWQEVVTGVII